MTKHEKRYGAKYVEQISENIERKSTILLTFDRTDMVRMDTHVTEWRTDLPVDDFSFDPNQITRTNRTSCIIPRFAAQVILLSGQFIELEPRVMWVEGLPMGELKRMEIPLRKVNDEAP